jgi:hypothetical protein
MSQINDSPGRLWPDKACEDLPISTDYTPYEARIHLGGQVPIDDLANEGMTVPQDGATKS